MCESLQSSLRFIDFLTGLGVKLVLAMGTQHFVDEQLKAQGSQVQYVGGYRVSSTLLSDTKRIGVFF